MTDILLTDIFKSYFWNKNIWVLNKNSLKIDLGGGIDYKNR